MINSLDIVAVTSRSFSKHLLLRKELLLQYPNAIFNDEGKSFAEEELIDFLKNSSKAIIALDRINDEILERLPNLKVISKYGVGLDKIDMDAIKKRKIILNWTPGVNKRSVAELTISLMIGILRDIYKANEQIKKNNWKQHQGYLLSNKTIGIIGLGNVGKDLSLLLKPFDVDIIYHDLIDYQEFSKAHDIQKNTLNDVLIKSDIVTIHVPYDQSTSNLISKEQLSKMKNNSFLINTARGGIVNEDDLKNALKNNIIAGAAFDVLKVEPPNNFELINLPNFFITPHIGGSAKEAIIEMGRAAIRGLEK